MNVMVLMNVETDVCRLSSRLSSMHVTCVSGGGVGGPLDVEIHLSQNFADD
jgi:hypothetical protein